MKPLPLVRQSVAVRVQDDLLLLLLPFAAERTGRGCPYVAGNRLLALDALDALLARKEAFVVLADLGHLGRRARRLNREKVQREINILVAGFGRLHARDRRGFIRRGLFGIDPKRHGEERRASRKRNEARGQHGPIPVLRQEPPARRP